MRELERFIVLQVVDTRWREHLENMDYLREGVHLRAMAQKDPLVEYTAEGHNMFEELGRAIREEVVHTALPRRARARRRRGQLERRRGSWRTAAADGAPSYEHQTVAGADAIAAAGGKGGGGRQASHRDCGDPRAAARWPPRPSASRDTEKIGRNDPCWCGSGKKFKKCHGA